LEERDLVAVFGDRYIEYRRRTGGLIPRWPQRSAQPGTGREFAN
jgi:hypothetical protein